jgi:hypothetical protein
MGQVLATMREKSTYPIFRGALEQDRAPHVFLYQLKIGEEDH